jgi:glutaredoxin
LLLQKYNIDPTPFVVELDTHPLGPQLQALLGDKTGRKTVPNIMVNGVSIGGFDTIDELDGKGELVAKVQMIGEARKVSMKLQG